MLDKIEGIFLLTIASIALGWFAKEFKNCMDDEIAQDFRKEYIVIGIVIIIFATIGILKIIGG